jgi:hypothetical protein
VIVIVVVTAVVMVTAVWHTSLQSKHDGDQLFWRTVLFWHGLVWVFERFLRGHDCSLSDKRCVKQLGGNVHYATPL